MKKISGFVLALVLMALLPFPSTSLAMTNPISSAKDYNGTFEGAPYTGTSSYSTLYRDNEDGGTTSGCNGEGCGKHPGVDIAIASGTNVYAALGGTVVRSECNGGGWGGLIVVQATNPYIPNETIYFTYAHLKQRSYSVGQYVYEGDILGLSGGGSGDYCPGNSTGPHLHFQIDKDDGNNSPWWPTNVNQADTSFEVMQKTYNPMVFVRGGYVWNFEQTGFPEYWTASNVSSWGVNSGILWIDGNSDPYIKRDGNITCSFSKPCSAQIAAEASIYKNVLVSIENYCTSNPVKIYFKTSVSNTWDEAKSVSFTYYNPATYSVDMSSNSNWTGIIRNIRIDPAVNCNPQTSDPNYLHEIGVTIP